MKKKNLYARTYAFTHAHMTCAAWTWCFFSSNFYFCPNYCYAVSCWNYETRHRKGKLITTWAKPESKKDIQHLHTENFPRFDLCGFNENHRQQNDDFDWRNEMRTSLRKSTVPCVLLLLFSSISRPFSSFVDRPMKLCMAATFQIKCHRI